MVSSERSNALRDGFSEVRRLSRESESGCRAYGRRWMLIHYGVGGPAVVAAAVSAALGGTGVISKVVAAVLAAVAGGLAALQTFFKPGTKWDVGKRYEHEFQAVAEEADLRMRSEITSEITAADVERLQAKLNSLTEKRVELVRAWTAPS